MASSALDGVDLCQFPAALPPSGETWNFVNPQTTTPATYSIGIILTVWAVTFAVARVYVNIRKLNLADYLVIIGTILDVFFTGVILSLAKYNRHQWDVPACWFDAGFMKKIFMEVLLVGPVLLFSKSAIFLMYRQFFWVYQPVRVAVYVGLVFAFLIYIPSIPFAAVYSAPRGGQTWEELIMLQATSDATQTGTAWGIVQGSCSVLLDIFIFVIPLPILAKLNLKASKRLQILAIFATALLGVAASVVALVYRVFLSRQGDTTWHLAYLGLAMMVENNVAIIVASMPAFANLMRLHVFESSFYKSVRSKMFAPKRASSGAPSIPSFVRGSLRTFGSPRRRLPSSGESMLMKSQSAPQGDSNPERPEIYEAREHIWPKLHFSASKPEAIAHMGRDDLEKGTSTAGSSTIGA